MERSTAATPCTKLRQGRLSVLCAACAVLSASAQSIPGSLLMPDLRQSVPVRTLRPGEPCIDCGYVHSVREVALERRASVPAAFAGGSRTMVDHNLVGAVVYLPLSSSSADKPFVGGVGTPEMRRRFGESTYAVTVRLDDGTAQVVQRPDGSRFQPGDRVRLVGASELELIVP
jgi:outer membrane lipoprotein SlyB